MYIYIHYAHREDATTFLLDEWYATTMMMIC